MTEILIHEIEQEIIHEQKHSNQEYLNEVVELFKSSESLATNLEKNFPKISELANHNVSGTLMYLKAKKTLSAYLISHSFLISYEGNERSTEVWKKYKDEIRTYVGKLFKDWQEKEKEKSTKDSSEKLLRMREVLSDYIHDEYYKKLPRWPSLLKRENNETLDLNVNDSYKYGKFSHIIWSCVGLVNVTDKRSGLFTLEAMLKGEPSIKILSFDFEKLQDLERFLKIEGSMNLVKNILERIKTKKFEWELLEE